MISLPPSKASLESFEASGSGKHLVLGNSCLLQGGIVTAVAPTLVQHRCGTPQERLAVLPAPTSPKAPGV